MCTLTLAPRRSRSKATKCEIGDLRNGAGIVVVVRISHLAKAIGLSSRT